MKTFKNLIECGENQKAFHSGQEIKVQVQYSFSALSNPTGKSVWETNWQYYENPSTDIGKKAVIMIPLSASCLTFTRTLAIKDIWIYLQRMI